MADPFTKQKKQNTGIEFKTATTSDPRRQLRNIEKREKEEHERRDEQLASDISSKILGESTEQRRQLQKAQLQEEEERMRTKHANLTALQAIGDTRSRPRAPPAGAAPPQPTATTAPTPAPTTTPQAPPSQQQLAVAMALSRFKPEQLQLMQRYQAMDKEGTITPQQKQQLVQFQVTLQKLQEKYRAAAPATQTTTPGGTSSTTASSKAGPSTTQVTMQDVSFLFQTDPFLHRKSKLALRHPLDNRTHSSS